jgi:hypothetical protein
MVCDEPRQRGAAAGMTATFSITCFFNDSSPPAGEARPPAPFIVGFFNNQMTGVFRGYHEATINRKP